MSDDTPQDEKTEEGTAQKQREFRERGEVAKSKELVSAVMLTAGVGAMVMLVQNLSRPMERMTHATLGQLHEVERFAQAPWAFMSGSVVEVLAALAAPVGVLIVAALAANFAQTGWLFSTKSFEFKPNKFNPITGLKRMFASKEVLVGLVRSGLKVMMLGSVAVGTVIKVAPDIGELVARGPLGFADYLMRVSLYPMGACALVMVGIGALDFAWQRHSMSKKMRMSKDEVKREMKQSEGDPMLKGRRRAKHMELLGTNRMVQEVAQADVIINNPTHISVAIRYRPAEGAPRVIAKGADAIAMRMREVARENEVEMITNIPLARALHSSCEVGHYIPEEFFRTVAQVLAHVYSTRPG